MFYYFFLLLNALWNRFNVYAGNNLQNILLNLQTYFLFYCSAKNKSTNQNLTIIKTVYIKFVRLWIRIDCACA